MRDITVKVTLEGYKKFITSATLADMNKIVHIRRGIARYDIDNDLVLWAIGRRNMELQQKYHENRDAVAKATAKNILRIMGEDPKNVTTSEAFGIIETFLSLDLDGLMSSLNA